MSGFLFKITSYLCNVFDYCPKTPNLTFLTPNLTFLTPKMALLTSNLTFLMPNLALYDVKFHAPDAKFHVPNVKFHVPDVKFDVFDTLQAKNKIKKPLKLSGFCVPKLRDWDISLLSLRKTLCSLRLIKCQKHSLPYLQSLIFPK